MLPRNHPDRIHITTAAWWPMPGCSFRPLARHLLTELVRQRLDLGDAPGRANTSDKMMTLVASALAGGELTTPIHRGDGQHPGRHGEGAIHPGHLPAQLPVGPRPSTRPGEPRVAGPGLAGRGGTRRRAPDH